MLAISNIWSTSRLAAETDFLTTYRWVLVELSDEVVKRLPRVHRVHEHTGGSRDTRDEFELGFRAASISRALRIGDLHELARGDLRRSAHRWENRFVDVVVKVLFVVTDDVRMDYRDNERESRRGRVDEDPRK